MEPVELCELMLSAAADGGHRTLSQISRFINRYSGEVGHCPPQQWPIKSRELVGETIKTSPRSEHHGLAASSHEKPRRSLISHRYVQIQVIH